MDAPKMKIKISKNGPYIVTGNVPLNKGIMVPDETRDPVRWEKAEDLESKNAYMLCRCGHSNNKPFCDDTHLEIGFDGTETASNIPYDEMARTLHGPNLHLSDASKYCASGRFCNRAGNAWHLTEHSNDPAKREIAIQETWDCPSGRLVARDAETGAAIEPVFEPQITVAEDPGRKVSGPLFVKGGINLVSFNGTEYETRNRMTLCRCGASKNKPFCDGSHISARFNDGDPRL
jgi:CDGSH-type Zn-finger protein